MSWYEFAKSLLLFFLGRILLQSAESFFKVSDCEGYYDSKIGNFRISLPIIKSVHYF